MCRFNLIIRSAAAALLLLAAPALAHHSGTHTSQRSGFWSVTGTWTNGAVPAAGDDVVIAANTWVMYDKPDDANAIDAAVITINAAGELSTKQGAGTLDVGGNGDGTAGGITVAGALTISNVVTITPDGNDDAVEDGITVQSGGRMDLVGAEFHRGTVKGVPNGDNGDTFSQVYDPCTDIVFTDGEHSLQPCADKASCDYVVVWMSGERKGRWHDVESIASDTITLDCDSRHANDRRGQPEYNTGTCSVTGTAVTCVGTDLTGNGGNGGCANTGCDDSLASGSFFWCADDTFTTEATRVRYLDDDTTMELAETYKGNGSCVGSQAAFKLLDVNEPWNGSDVSEQIRVGDQYAIIRPATIESATGTESTLDNQTWVKYEAGSGGTLIRAAFRWVGSENMAAAGGFGVDIRGDLEEFDTVEVMDCAGEACLLFYDVPDLDVHRPFVHWANSAIDLEAARNEAHGLMIDGTGNGRVRIYNGRVERVGDDCYWRNGVTADGSGVFESICKWTPNIANGSSVDGLDSGDGTNGGTWLAHRNLFTNIGGYGSDSSACLASGLREVDAWAGGYWLALDNQCINMQVGKCFSSGFGGAVPNVITARVNRAFWVNNACHVAGQGGADIVPWFYQNTMTALNSSENSGTTPTTQARNISEYHGNISLCLEDLDDCTGLEPTSSLINRTVFHNAQWRFTNNVIAGVADQGIVATDWNNATYPAASGYPAQITHNTIVFSDKIVGNSQYMINGTFHDGLNGDAADVENNALQCQNNNCRGTNGFDADSTWSVDSNLCNHDLSAGCWGSFAGDVNTVSGSHGMNIAAREFTIRPKTTAANMTTTDGDQVGALCAGVDRSRLPYPALMPNLPRRVEVGDACKDSDLDGLADKWDNCDDLQNWGWRDTDGDGVGDACDPTP